MKKTISLFSLTLVAILAVAFMIINRSDLNSKDNGFRRKFLSAVAVKSHHEFLLPSSRVHEIIGTGINHIYLSTKNPGEVYSITTDLRRLEKLNINIDTTDLLQAPVFNYIDSPMVYMLSGGSRMIVTENINTKEHSCHIFSDRRFYRALHVTDMSFILTFMDTLAHDPYLAKVVVNSGIIPVKKNISEPAGDAGIVSDGFMVMDIHANKIFFVSYYKNRFQCLDSDLNLLYASRTIDTNTKAKVSIRKNGTSITNSTPEQIINVTGCASGGFLFVYSSLKGDNESSSDLSSHYNIDIYSEGDGSYTGSFQLPTLGREKLKKIMIIHDTTLVTLFSRRVTTDVIHITRLVSMADR